MALSKERRGEIAVAVLKEKLRNETSLRRIPDIKRAAGNMIRDPAIKAAKISSEEIVEFGKELLTEVFEEQMKTL